MCSSLVSFAYQQVFLEKPYLAEDLRLNGREAREKVWEKESNLERIQIMDGRATKRRKEGRPKVQKCPNIFKSSLE